MFRPLLKDRSKQSSLCLLTGAVSLFFAAGCVSAKLTGGNLSDIGLLVAAAIGITAVAWSCYRHYKLLRLEILELRAQNLQLDRAVNNITQALIVFDGQANLVLCNERYRQMYGLCPEMVRPGTSLHSLLLHRKELGNFSGDTERYHAEILADIATGKTTAKTVELDDGRIITLVNKPLPGGAWVSTHQDVTDLHQARRQAQQSHARLAAVIEAMPAGLILYDDQDRLVLWNKCYNEMHPAVSDVRVKGARFEDILRAAVERRMAPEEAVGREEEWIAARLATQAAPQHVSEHHYPDGRWLRIQTCRTADGGSIGIHVDITEFKRREEELNVQNMRFEAALQNMSRGLAMFDREQMLVICNDEFLQVYGLPAELARPGTPLQDILTYRVTSGSLRPPDREHFIQSRVGLVLAGEPSDSIIELRDGRRVAVGHRPMADGGWVSTHEDVTESWRIQEQISHLARHDALTDLPNRLLFHEFMTRALARARRGEIVALHCIDLDQFKGINDVLGHVAGDTLLMQVAARLRDCVRDVDLVARFGGDEFAVVQVGLQRPKDAEVLANRIVRVLSQPYVIDSHPASISASIGIAVAPTDGMDTDELLRKADIAMYRAKAEGRQTARHFSPEMDEALQARRVLAVNLERALRLEEFDLFYQPIVNITTEEVIGFEALLRWWHPERGLVSPSEFISLAEEKGFILELGDWALRRACRDAVEWPAHLTVSVNLSPLQLRSGKLVRGVVHALAESGLPVVRLILEITESVLLQKDTASTVNLAQLKNLGVAIAMDDFGTGYSSLSSLHHFSFDKIKIDRSFVNDLTEGCSAIAIVRAVTSLAKSLGIVVTAEGVESRDQLKLLRAEGCHEAQGYLFGHPRPSNELSEILARCKQCEVRAA
jgi:diguanylate cyclase (GGDEF)-like protein